MRILAVVGFLAAASCASPDHHRWTVQTPFDLHLGEGASLRGLRFQDEMPILKDWTLYFAGSIFDLNADGSDPGTASDVTDVLTEGALGLRHYFTVMTPMQPFAFGEVALGNAPFRTLEGVNGVYSATFGFGSRGQIDRDWSIEAAIAYRFTQVHSASGAYPGLDLDDALTGVLVFVGIGYTW